MQKANATQIAKKNHQLKYADYYEMLHKVLKESAAVEEANTSQKDATVSRKSASQRLTKLRDMKGKYTCLINQHGARASHLQ